MTPRIYLALGLLFVASAPAHAGNDAGLVARAKVLAQRLTGGSSRSVRRFTSRVIAEGNSLNNTGSERAHPVFIAEDDYDPAGMYGTVEQSEARPGSVTERKLGISRFNLVTYWSADRTTSEGTASERVKLVGSKGGQLFLGGEQRETTVNGNFVETTHVLRSEMTRAGGLFSERGLTRVVVNGMGENRKVSVPWNLKAFFIGPVPVFPLGRNLKAPVEAGYGLHISETPSEP